MSDARVEQLAITGSLDAWRDLGLSVTDDGEVPFMFTSLRIRPAESGDPVATTGSAEPAGRADSDPGAPGDPGPGPDGAGADDAGAGPSTAADRAAVGLHAWALSGIDPSITEIDGLPTEAVEPPPPVITEHPNSAIEIDHVVVLTSSLDRTCTAIEEATGSPLKRVREVGSMRQGFHRMGPGGLIVEVVERPEVTGDHATFWGVVLNVRDLDAAVELIGPDRISEPKEAVQPGRRIATVRHAAGLGTAVALMTP